jgi:hypothetical protein
MSGFLFPVDPAPAIREEGTGSAVSFASVSG